MNTAIKQQVKFELTDGETSDKKQGVQEQVLMGETTFRKLWRNMIMPVL